MNDTTEREEFPEHWSWTPLGKLGEWGSGGTPKSDNDAYYGGDIPWLKIGDLNNGAVAESEENITQKGLQESSAELIPEDALLVAMYGSIGKLGITGFQCASNQAIAYCIPDTGSVSLKFLFWGLRHYQTDLIESGKGGVQKNISQTVLKNFEIPLPPLSEQRRIVAKIEELFSDLEAGVADLKRAKKQLQRYRKSVLQAAVEGRLTKAWREERDTESADKLLERILEERRAQWEKDYRAKYEAKGKEPPSGWKSRYTPPEKPDASGLPSLPERWTWTNMQQLSIVYGGVTKNARKGGDLATLPYLRVANVYADELRLDEIKQIGVKRQRVYKYLLEEGDLLVVEGNGSKSQIGRVAQWDGSIEPCVHQNHLIKVRPCIREVGDYLLHWMLSLNGRSHITNVASSTSGLYTLSLTKVRSIPVPLPPLEEQRQIVNETERLLSVANEATQTVEREIKRAERLRQSILKQAFSGQLVEKEKRSGKVGEMLPLFDEEATRQVQNKEANNALKNLRGQWPGEESIDELLDALD